jgi:prolyl-tRNA synthetase
MYPYYAKWIHSHRDLPLKLNQWTNIVRWEFKDPTPFIRTREFLWQEGHTAHATLVEADKMVMDMLEVYKKCYEELLAIPVIKGKKSEEEKFPGALYTTSVETIIPSNGRGVQAATSHNLGQNFSKMFEIYFENEKKERELVWQTSWGFTTRSIGIMILMHGDDKGAIIPPRVAPIQAVVIPIFYKDLQENAKITAKISEIDEMLKSVGVRTKVDDRDIYTPGWKYNHWELKGVPLRIEFGMKDYNNSSVFVARRDTGEKVSIKWENLKKEIPAILEKTRPVLAPLNPDCLH